ncbi:hypothetical protein [Arthrobacter tumbae]|uniref:hypothetical protein n=1 Tax=Arthrobacter tumbae TaxID=163874 RepID=UPI00195BA05C|nr:hypothetical protein [Arthrobacter tumbae]MBM7780631.1 hypothetical protein [Arthrobacter tumbae]
MGIQTQRVVLAVSGLLVALMTSACTPSAVDPAEVDPASMDVESWSQSVLGMERGMSFAGRHQGAAASGGSFYDVEPGWYEVTMACAGGDAMALELLADGTTLSNGTTSCDSPAVTAHIELRAAADELTLRASNSGAEMLWTVGLVPGGKPGGAP